MPDNPAPEPAPAPEPDAAELEAAATVSEPDVAEALAAWRRHAPAAYRDLLDAEDSMTGPS